MPILKNNSSDIDYIDVGTGPAVVLIHSAASNNRQWRQLIDAYQGQYRFLVINLYGYGQTSRWPDDATQSMADQVGLVEAVCALAEGRVSVVGHFFGGAVVASAARAMNEKVGALVLLEANSFPLLDAHDKHEAHKEFIELRGFTKLHGAKGDWNKVAERFTDYWLGEGAWLPTL